MPPPTIAGIVSAKKLIRNRLARLSARKYTHVWNKVMKEAQGIDPKTNKIPPGFTGKNKHERALLYQNRIVNYALKHPKKINSVLFRGISGWEAQQFKNKNTVKKNTMSSFTKNLNKAYEFSGIGGAILKLYNTRKIPAINFTSGNFQSEFDEKEVLLPPGTFKVVDSFFSHYHQMMVYVVSFEPTMKNTSYLHRAPQKPKYYTGKRGGIYTLTPNGKTKKYISKKKKSSNN